MLRYLKVHYLKAKISAKACYCRGLTDKAGLILINLQYFLSNTEMCASVQPLSLSYNHCQSKLAVSLQEEPIYDPVSMISTAGARGSSVATATQAEADGGTLVYSDVRGDETALIDTCIVAMPFLETS